VQRSTTGSGTADHQHVTMDSVVPRRFATTVPDCGRRASYQGRLGHSSKQNCFFLSLPTPCSIFTEQSAHCIIHHFASNKMADTQDQKPTVTLHWLVPHFTHGRRESYLHAICRLMISNACLHQANMQTCSILKNSAVAAYKHNLTMTTSNQFQAREVPLPAHCVAP
jgi:hypothetical protein